METLEQFIAKQEQALAEKRAEIAELEAIGPIPGLTPWLIHGKLYGVRHIDFKLVDLQAFLAWAREHCIKIHAVEGHYKILHQHIPDTRDYRDARIAASGDVDVRYSTIMQRYVARFCIPGYTLSFELDTQPANGDLRPHPQWSGQKISGWTKGRRDIRQYLRVAVDRQSADTESLLTFEQFEGYFTPGVDA